MNEFLIWNPETPINIRLHRLLIGSVACMHFAEGGVIVTSCRGKQLCISALRRHATHYVSIVLHNSFFSATE